MQSGVSDFQIAPNNIQEKYSLQSFYSWQTKVVKPPPKMLSTFPAPHLNMKKFLSFPIIKLKYSTTLLPFPFFCNF